MKSESSYPLISQSVRRNLAIVLPSERVSEPGNCNLTSILVGLGTVTTLRQNGNLFPIVGIELTTRVVRLIHPNHRPPPLKGIRLVPGDNASVSGVSQNNAAFVVREKSDDVHVRLRWRLVNGRSLAPHE